jgi:hypothetical protein
LLIPTSDFLGRHLRDRLWKLAEFHVPASHPYSALLMTIEGLTNNILVKSLVYNWLQDHAVPAQRRGRSISVPLAGSKGHFQEQRVHVPGNCGRSKKARNKQARCLRCYRDEGVLQWTFFYCVQCRIPLCMSGSRHIGGCFEHHMRLDPICLVSTQHETCPHGSNTPRYRASIILSSSSPQFLAGVVDLAF